MSSIEKKIIKSLETKKAYHKKKIDEISCLLEKLLKKK